MQLSTHQHRTYVAARQSAEMPSKLQSVAFWELLTLHILHNENILFLRFKSCWTVSMFNYVDTDHIFLQRCMASRCRQCVVYMDRFMLPWITVKNLMPKLIFCRYFWLNNVVQNALPMYSFCNLITSSNIVHYLFTAYRRKWRVTVTSHAI